jgi:hypothetical protein
MAGGSCGHGHCITDPDKKLIGPYEFAIIDGDDIHAEE